MPHGSELKHIQNRTNLPTDMTSKAISKTIPPKIRAQSFFSARVAESNILDRFREITDSYMTGKIGRDEARNLMLEYARANNRDDGTRAITNLASSARLNLIIDQNASMARAVGDYERMYSTVNKKLFPYVIYHASVGSRKPRSEHQRYDGMIFEKDDPWLKTHWPPWDFNCHCRLENCTDKKAHKTPDLIQPPTPPDKVTIDTKSGYSFDPAHAFEKFDLGSVKDDAARAKVHDGLLAFCQKGNFSGSFYGAPPQKLLPESYREPGNIEEIREIFRKIENRKNVPLENFEISLGKILPEHAARLGLKDFKEDIIFKHEKGNKRVGPNHWARNHSDTLNEKDAIDIFRYTIWNPNAELREDVVGTRRRICFYVKDKDTGKLTNVWVVKDNAGELILEVVDSWNPERQYIDHLGSHHTKKASRSESNR